MKYLAIFILFGLQFSYANLNKVDHSYKFYGVVFGITLDKKGELIDLKVARVLDPACKSCKPKVKVSKVFVQNVRKHIKARGLKPKIKDGVPQAFYTYYIYDPLRADRIDLDPKSK